MGDVYTFYSKGHRYRMYKVIDGTRCDIFHSKKGYESGKIKGGKNITYKKASVGGFSNSKLKSLQIISVLQCRYVTVFNKVIPLWKRDPFFFILLLFSRAIILEELFILSYMISQTIS